MKNIQENIARVKSLMNLLTEGSTNPKDWKVGEYYIQTRKGSNIRNIIKITYKDESNISFDYVEYDETTKEKKETGTHDKIGVNQVPTQADGAIWEESNETVWNEISKSTTTQPTNSNNGQIPKTKSYSPEIGLNTFVKNESLNILNDNKYMFFHGLDENRNIKDGELDIMYDPKENESLLIKVFIYIDNTYYPELTENLLYNNNRLYNTIFLNEIHPSDIIEHFNINNNLLLNKNKTIIDSISISGIEYYEFYNILNSILLGDLFNIDNLEDIIFINLKNIKLNNKYKLIQPIEQKIHFINNFLYNS